MEISKDKYIKILDKTQKEMDCDVVIRIKNEEKNLPRLYESLKKQKDVKLNIIVLDSESKDGSVNIVNKWENVLLFTIKERDFNFGESLNFLFSKCESKYIFCFSAHVYFEDVYLFKDIIEYLNLNEKMAGYFRQIPNKYTGCSCLERAFLERNFVCKNEPEQIKNDFNRIYFSNAGSVYNRGFWSENKFDNINGSEDKIWAKKILDKKTPLIYFGNKVIHHSHNETNDEIYNRLLLNYKQQNLFYGKKHNPYAVFFRYFSGMIYYNGIGEIYKIYRISLAALRASRDAI